jgi:hypothetical protein
MVGPWAPIKPIKNWNSLALYLSFWCFFFYSFVGVLPFSRARSFLLLMRPREGDQHGSWVVFLRAKWAFNQLKINGWTKLQFLKLEGLTCYIAKTRRISWLFIEDQVASIAHCFFVDKSVTVIRRHQKSSTKLLFLLPHGQITISLFATKLSICRFGDRQGTSEMHSCLRFSSISLTSGVNEHVFECFSPCHSYFNS